LTVRVPVVSVMEALGRVPNRVIRLGHNGVPWYPRHKTPIVAPEPFVERVARVVRSPKGEKGTHMLLRVLSNDRVATMGHRCITGVGTYLHYKYV
jgi:hypothetical protein